MTIRDELLALREQIDALLAGLPGELGAPVVPLAARVAARARYLSVPQFAAAFGYSARTVRDYCAQGLPHIGQGKSRRVLVEEARAWIEGGGPQRARKVRAA